MVSTAGGIIIAIIVLALAAAVGWIVFSQMRARRLGVSVPLPPPLDSPPPQTALHPAALAVKR